MHLAVDVTKQVWLKFCYWKRLNDLEISQGYLIV